MVNTTVQESLNGTHLYTSSLAARYRKYDRLKSTFSIFCQTALEYEKTDMQSAVNVESTEESFDMRSVPKEIKSHPLKGNLLLKPKAFDDPQSSAPVEPRQATVNVVRHILDRHVDLQNIMYQYRKMLDKRLIWVEFATSPIDAVRDTATLSISTVGEDGSEVENNKAENDFFFRSPDTSPVST